MRTEVPVKDKASPVGSSLGRGGLYGPKWLFSSDAINLKCIKSDSELILERVEFDYDLSGSTPSFVGGHRLQSSFSVSYRLMYVASRHVNELYLAGVARNGDGVIERWVFPPQVGGYYTEKATASTALGVDAPIEQLYLKIGSNQPGQGQGPFAPPFIAPIGRSVAPQPIREEIYRGQAIGEVCCMAVDPEGRFLLLMDRSSPDVYRLTMGANPVLESLYDDSDFASFAAADSFGVTPMLHALEGRKYVLTTYVKHRPSHKVVFHDVDNDGLFESAEELSESEYDSSYPSYLWVDRYNEYTFQE